MSHKHHHAAETPVKTFSSEDAQRLSRNEREELNALSSKVYGRSSRWQKLIRGVPVVALREGVEQVPAHTVTNEDGTTTEVEATTRNVQRTIKHGNNGVLMTMERLSLQEVYTRMTQISAFIDTVRANQAAKEAAEREHKEIHNQMAGHS